MLVITVPQNFTDGTLPTLQRDPLLSGAAGGVRFLFDTAFPFSWPKLAAPADGDAVVDVAEHANGLFVKSATEAVAYNGGGFDFSTMTSTASSNHDAHVKMPASVWADIFASQYFMVCAYLRLPSAADWNASASILPFFASGLTVGGYTSEIDPLTLDFSSGNILQARRQTAVGAAVTLASGAIGVGYQGALAQVAYWRNAAGIGLRIQSAAGTLLYTGAVGATNSADFSSVQGRFGIVQPFTDFATNTLQRAGRNFRLYRGFVENLATSGRDPATVLAADWTRTVARAAFT